MAITRTPLVDDDGSGHTGTVLNNAWLTALYDALDAAITAPWVVPTFSAANFTAGASMTWTVDAGDVVTCAYRLQGKTMQVVFELTTTSVGGTLSTALLIGNGAWGGAVAKRAVAATISYFTQGGVLATAIAQVFASGTTILINKADGSNMAASTNGTTVYGSITFEVN